MNREVHKWNSPALGREMEMLVFGHGGTPVLVFPSSMGQFFDYERWVDQNKNMSWVGASAALLG